MGHHYVPQRYLRNFQTLEKPGEIWQYTKSNGAPKRIPIKNVAQAKGFYHPEVETHLANEIEPAGSEVIDKILARKPIDSADRLALGIYLGVMMKRVPAQRRRVEEMVPEMITEVMTRFRTIASTFAVEAPERVDVLLTEADRIEKKVRAEHPLEIKDQIRSPYPSENVFRAILSMEWRVLEADGPQMLITSDNPFFYTRGYGLGNPRAEFLLPLSPNYVLHGSRYPAATGAVSKLAQRGVRQANRRIAHDAEVAVFTHEKQSWIPRVLSLPSDGGYVPNGILG